VESLFYHAGLLKRLIERTSNARTARRVPGTSDPQPIAWPGSSTATSTTVLLQRHDRTGNIFVISGIGYYPTSESRTHSCWCGRRHPDRGACFRRDRSGPAQPARQRIPDRGRRAAAQTAVISTKPKALQPISPGKACSPSSRNSRTCCGPETGHVGRATFRATRQLERTHRHRRRGNQGRPATWLGSRDRSWGIRPIVRQSRRAGRRPAFEGCGGSTCRWRLRTSRSC